MHDHTMEHRWGDRVLFDIPVQYVGASRTMETGRLKNFSISGAFVEAEVSPPVLTRIALMITDPWRRLQNPPAIMGYVVRQSQHGFGMSWWNLAPVTVAHLIAVSETVMQGAGVAE